METLRVCILTHDVMLKLFYAFEKCKFFFLRWFWKLGVFINQKFQWYQILKKEKKILKIFLLWNKGNAYKIDFTFFFWVIFVVKSQYRIYLFIVPLWVC